MLDFIILTGVSSMSVYYLSNIKMKKRLRVHIVSVLVKTLLRDVRPNDYLFIYEFV